MLYNAMFDEVDEATAMCKIAATASDAPTSLQIINMDTDGECLPSERFRFECSGDTPVVRGYE